MQVITKYYLKSHLHIKRIKCMLSHLALSFPPPSLGFGGMHRNQHTTPAKPGALDSLAVSSQRGLMDAETWKWKGTFAGKISGLKHHVPTRLTATYATKCQNPSLTLGLHETSDLIWVPLPLHFVLNIQAILGHSIYTKSINQLFRTQLKSCLLWEAFQYVST